MLVARILGLFVSTSLATAATASPATNNVQGRAEGKKILHGFIQSTSNTTFGAVFFDNFTAYEFRGSYDDEDHTELWSVLEGVVSYDDASQLAGTWDFFGTIGPDDVDLRLEAEGDGPVVSFSGPLEDPVPLVFTSGTGNWTSQKVAA